MSALILRRAAARKLIDAVRVLDAQVEAGDLDHDGMRRGIRVALRRAGLPALTQCTGAAHSNPNIDNCLTCAPRWGWCGEEAKIT